MNFESVTIQKSKENRPKINITPYWEMFIS